jgi:hypothetical protein
LQPGFFSSSVRGAMRSPIKKILVVLAVAAIAIQFFPAARNVSAAAPGPNDIAVLYPIAPDTKALLAESCYDCHSDHTRYPWYTRIQPVGWWMEHHVNEGKRHLNFSQFGAYTAKRARHKLEEVVKETKAGKMPLPSYLVIHRHANLTDAQVRQVADWADGVRARIPAPTAP